MKNAIIAAAIVAVGALSSTAAASSAVTGYFSHETVSGMSKTCYYDTIHGTMAFSTDATALCPLSKTFHI